MRMFGFTALGAAALLSAPAVGQNVEPRDLTVEQTTVAQAGVARPGSLHVSLSADRPDATYAVGESVKLTLTANEEAYVTVFDVGPTGRVTQIFPNQYQTDDHIHANRPIRIAGGNSGSKVTAVGPVGAELIKVVASNKPMTVVSQSHLQGRGIFRTIDGGAETLLRDLQVTSDHAAAQGDTKIALANFALRTVSARISATSAQTLVIIPTHRPAPGASVPNLQPIVAPGNGAQETFPLLVAIDRPSYRVGERVTLAVTPTQACNLMVLDIATSGEIRTLFPNAATPNNAVGAMQTVLVAGGTSPVSLPVSGPAGTEQIVALCAGEAVPTGATAIASRPTAMASMAFAVQP